MTDVIAPPGTHEPTELHLPPEVPGDGHEPHGGHEDHGPTGILKWLTSTDHKVIGLSYMITAIVIFYISGIMALFMRLQLASPHSSLLSFSQFNALFTMHGGLMLYLFAGPFAFGGLANYIVPLQVGAPDMAFPRLNALSYWLYLTGSITMLLGFFVAGGAAQFGWVAYAPLSSATSSPGAGPDLFLMGIALTGFSAIFTGVNLCGTIFYLRAPGMTMFRMPIFTWNMLVTGILILIAFPVLTAAVVMLFCDRHFGTHIYTATGCHLVNGHAMVSCGSPLLWQNLFWFFGHPEVYILALPFFGIVTEILPVFSRRPVFGYKGMVFATMAIAALSTGVWAHHMFTTGAVLLPFFSILSLLIAVPTGIKFFNWIGTMWHGQLTFTTPMLFTIGFLFAFLMGGVTGIMLGLPPDRLRRPRHLLRGGPLPPGSGRHGRLRRFRRGLLLVPQDVRPHAAREPGQVALLAAVHRLLGHLHAPVRGRAPGHAAPGGQLPLQPRLAELQPRLYRGRLHHRRLVRLPAGELRRVVAQAHPGRGQPLGCPHARVVHDLAAAAPQLHPPAAHPLGASDVGLQPPGRLDRPPRQGCPHQREGQRKGHGFGMKVSAVFLLFLGAFFGIVGLVYWFWSYEDGGGMMLLGVTLLGFLPGLYYFFWHRRFHGHKYFFWGKIPAAGDRPSDREDAEMADGAGVIDAFPGSSIWPFVLGMGAFTTVLALIFGIWLAFIGVPLILTALAGVTAESRRGGNV